MRAVVNTDELVSQLTGMIGGHPWPAGEVPRLCVPGIRSVDGPRGVVIEVAARQAEDTAALETVVTAS